MNTRKSKAKVKNFLIILENVCSSTIVMGRLVEKLSPYIDAPKKWHAEAVNITTNIKVKVDFTLLPLSVTNVETWKCLVNEYAKGRYEMILGRYILA